jgi:hypothetical protein
MPPDLPARVSVLEEIAGALKVAIERIDRRLETIERNQRSDVRRLLGIMLAGFGATLTGFIGLLGLMARGFHWL